MTALSNKIAIAIGQDPESVELAYPYILTMIPGFYFNMLFMIGFFLANSVRRFDIPAKGLLLATIAHFALNAIFLIWLDWGIYGAALSNTIHLMLRFVFGHIFALRNSEIGPILRESYDAETFQNLG